MANKTKLANIGVLESTRKMMTQYYVKSFHEFTVPGGNRLY